MVNQIEIEGYTRTGFRVVVKDTAKNADDAKRIIESVGIMGLLPEKPEKPDKTDYGWISHVALTYTEDNTPHIAFFHENKKLENRWTHKYLNSAQERIDFEAWAGISLDGKPSMEGNVHPQRGKAAQAKFLIPLPQVKALIRLTTFEKVQENGQDIWQPINDVERYIGAAKTEQKKDDTPKHWWESNSELERVKAWEAVARSAKPQFVDIACKTIAPMKEFATSADYIEALKQIAINEEKKASGEKIPF